MASVETSVTDGIGWLTLRRPETRNAIDPAFVEAAVVALDELPAGIGGLVVSGEGPAFSALGLSPDSGTSYYLTRALGSPAANAAFLRNCRLGAADLVARGLADEVAPDGAVAAAAQRLAAEVGGASPAALLATRRLVDAAPTHGLDAHLDLEAETISGLWNSPDVVEGTSAFIERRRPRFPDAAAQPRRAR